MTARPSCGSCRYYRPSTRSCHRHPPVAVLLPPGRLEVEVRYMLPQTEATFWCGEHQPAVAFAIASVDAKKEPV